MQQAPLPEALSCGRSGLSRGRAAIFRGVRIALAVVPFAEDFERKRDPDGAIVQPACRPTPQRPDRKSARPVGMKVVDHESMRIVRAVAFDKMRVIGRQVGMAVRDDVGIGPGPSREADQHSNERDRGE